MDAALALCEELETANEALKLQLSDLQRAHAQERCALSLRLSELEAQVADLVARLKAAQESTLKPRRRHKHNALRAEGLLTTGEAAKLKGLSTRRAIHVAMQRGDLDGRRVGYLWGVVRNEKWTAYQPSRHQQANGRVRNKNGKSNPA